jgi:hypothetical protein
MLDHRSGSVLAVSVHHEHVTIHMISADQRSQFGRMLPESPPGLETSMSRGCHLDGHVDAVMSKQVVDRRGYPPDPLGCIRRRRLVGQQDEYWVPCSYWWASRRWRSSPVGLSGVRSRGVGAVLGPAVG